MRWSPLSRRAAQFAARLDGRQVAGSLDDDTAALVSLAERLREVEPPVMSAAYAAHLRARLMEAAPEVLASATVVPVPTARPFPLRRSARPLRVGIAVATTIVAATGAGVEFASQKALPGDPLYPIKQTLEHVQVAAAGSLTDTGNEQLDQASTRLLEVHDLATRGSADPVTSILMETALGDFSNQANDGAMTMVQAYQQDNSVQAIVDLRQFTTESVASLSQLQTTVPPGVLDSVGAAASQLKADDGYAVAACSTCTAEPALVLPAALAAIAPTKPPVGTAPTDPATTVLPTATTVLPTATSVSTDASVSAADPTAAAPSSIDPSVIAPTTGLVGPSTGVGASSLPTGGTVITTLPVPPASAPDPSAPETSAPTTAPETAPSSTATQSPPTTVSSPTVPTLPTESSDPIQSSVPPPSGLTSAPISGSAPTSAPPL